jgi:hypothetical protein
MRTIHNNIHERIFNVFECCSKMINDRISPDKDINVWRYILTSVGYIAVIQIKNCFK